MTTIDKAIPTSGYSTTVRKTLLLGKNGTSRATVANPVPVDAIVSVDTMSLTAEMSEATGQDYYVTTTNLGDGTLTIGFDNVSANLVGATITLSEVIKVENKTQGWIYNTKGATVGNTSILLVAANQTTGYPVPGAADEFEVVYRGIDRIGASNALLTTIDSDTDAIKTSVELIDDAVYTDGTGTPSKGIVVMGTDGTNSQILSCNSDGELKVNLETGDIEIGAVELKNASTDDRASIEAANTARTTATLVLATQGIDESGAVLKTSTIETNSGTIAGDTTSLDAKAPALGTAAMVASSPVTLATDDTLTTAGNALLTTIDSDTNDIKTAVELIDDTVATIDTGAGASVKGLMMFGIRNDTPATPLVDTDKDYTTFCFNSFNEMYTVTPSDGGDDDGFSIGTSQVSVIGGVYTTDEVDAGDQGALSMTVDRKLRTECHNTTAVPESAIDTTGADAYATVLTPSTTFSKIMISNEGSNPATVSIDAGTTDNFIRIPGNCVQTFEGITITAVAIQAKNANAGNNYSNLTITVW